MEDPLKNQCCRCCMMKNEENSEMIYLFNNINTLQVFSKCTSLEAVENDCLPSYICIHCHSLLQKFYEFRIMCVSSDISFKEQIKKKFKTELESEIDGDSNIKVEPLDVIKIDDEKRKIRNKIPLVVNRAKNVKITNERDEIKEEKEMEEEVDYDSKKCDEDDQQYNVESFENDDDYDNNDDDDLEGDSECNDDENENSNRRTTRYQSKKVIDQQNKKGDAINSSLKRKLTTKLELGSNVKGSKAIFPCNLCNRKFFREIRLEGHLRQHQGLKPAVCKLCGKEFSKFGGLNTHIMYAHNNSERKFICDEPNCGRSYIMKQSLVSHKKSSHCKNPEQKKTNCYICEQCGKSFSSTDALKKHMYIHTGQKPFNCLLCPKKYVTNHKLKEHMMRHEGIKNYVCTVCGLGKTTQHELKVHVNYHTREKLYPCKSCSSVFTSTGNRGRHYKIVHCGIKAYQCTHCDRSFGKAETLKHHTMTHTGEKPHCCSVCDKRFIQLVALQSHMKTHNKKK